MAEAPEKFEGSSLRVAEEQKAKLKSLFPEVFTEGGKIDFDRLRLTLGDDTLDLGKERYGMNWPGKADCFKTIQKPSMATLVPARNESVDFDRTENLIIEGDNLEVLKLLQKAYLGKVKMIYIDPPYNTGNEFIYPDNYSESLETYLRYTGQVDAEGRKFSTNTEADGRFHSKWLNMMYPRLFLARNLLRDDGVIFISIDDHELDNLKKLCNEIFGEENFIGQAIWQKKYSPQNDAKLLSELHEYVLGFARNAASWKPNLLPRTEEGLGRYKNPDDDPRGPWKAGDLTSKTKAAGHSYPITSPTGKVHFPTAGRQWAPAKDTFEKWMADGRIWFGPDGNNVPSLKQFLSEVQAGTVPTTLWLRDLVGDNQEAANQIAELSLKFDSPKPTRLISHMLKIATDGDGDIVLDFFAGSGTTGQAVLELDAQDGKRRKFILAQLPEPIEQNEFDTICGITKERLRRVIDKFNQSGNSASTADRGFKVFKLQSSNFKAWSAEHPKDEADLAKQLTLHVDHLVEGRSQEDLLYELLLKSGFPLDTQIEKVTLADKTVFSIADGMMLVCLEHELTLDVLRAMADKIPERVVCLDAGFANNDQLKTNAVQTMKAKGVTKFQTV